jgi:hypothetical protein
MAAAKSTRLSIVEQAVADILERLADMKPEEAASTVKIRELRTKALAYERTVKGWLAHPPSEAQRSAMLKLVLELNMQVMAFARGPAIEEKPAPTVTGYVPKRVSSKASASAKPAKRG